MIENNFSESNLFNNFIKDGGVRQVFFAITNRCDADCLFCGFQRTKRMKRKTLDVTDVLNSLDFMRENNFRIVSFTGGEPLLHSSLPSIIKHASQNGMLTRTGTNGIRLSKPLISDFKEANLGYLWISIDSDIPEKHDQNRGKKGLYIHIENMVKIAEQYELKIGAGVAISNLIQNYEQLLNKLIDMGFTRVTFAYPGETMDSSYRANSSNAISFFSNEKLASILEEILKLKLSGSFPIEVGNSAIALKMMIQHLRYNQSLSPCYAGSRLFYLDWELQLYRCYSLKDHIPLFEFDPSTPDPQPCDACNSQCFRDNSLYYPALNSSQSTQSLKAWTELLVSSNNPFT